ncbi:MAG: hypothetical protein NBV67_17775 [Tagaea sp.]|nr:hypothetical protein [Tagaea sp.]
MSDSVVVTGADAKYFRFAADTLRSLLALGLEREARLALLDFGLADDQRQWAAARGISVVPVGWDIELGTSREPELAKMGDGYKAMTARPFLPAYFPDAGVIQWIDADAWVQTAEGVRGPLEAAKRHGFAVVPELHRAYAHLYSGGEGTQAMHRTAAAKSFGDGVAAALARNPILNSGLFAGRADSPVWGKWRDFAAAGMARHVSKYTEQIALNLACYTTLGTSDGDAVQFLPAEYNFCCGLALPKIDRQTRAVLDPKFPNAPVHVVHLVGMTERREFACPTGGTFESSLIYSDLRGPIPA